PSSAPSSLSLHDALPIFRINMHDLRARCALAAAAGGADRAPLLALAERDVKRLERERLAWADALALLLRAGLSAARGEAADVAPDRKSTRLNSSHQIISY